MVGIEVVDGDANPASTAADASELSLVDQIRKAMLVTLRSIDMVLCAGLYLVQGRRCGALRDVPGLRGVDAAAGGTWSPLPP